MRIAAGDGQSGLGETELGSDDMDDALTFVIDAVMSDIVDAAVFLEQPDHVARIGIFCGVDTAFAADSRHIVIRHGEVLPRLAHLAAFLGQCAEGMKRAFMYKVAVDVQQRVTTRFFQDDVAVPDFVEHR